MIGVACAAGTGCHSCWPDLRALLDETRAPEAVPGRRHDARPASMLEAVATGLVAPIWRAQGIGLHALSIEGETVRVEVGAIGPDALASPIGATSLARHALREALSETARVELAPPPAR